MKGGINKIIMEKTEIIVDDVQDGDVVETRQYGIDLTYKDKSVRLSVCTTSYPNNNILDITKINVIEGDSDNLTKEEIKEIEDWVSENTDAWIN